MAAVAAEFDGRVRFLGVPGRGDVAEMRAFVTETGTGGLTHLVDADGSLWARFGVVVQPAFAFVGGDGTVQTHTGGLAADELRRRTAALLAREPR